MNELKPEDVMKALECCEKGTREECAKCPRQTIPSITEDDCMYGLMRSALALLHEKDAEIERLKQEHKDYIEDVTVLLSEKNTKCEKLMRENEVYANGIKKVAENYHRKGRAEAITEFAERLKQASYADCTITGYKHYIVDIEEIDQIAKEMKGETDERSD